MNYKYINFHSIYVLVKSEYIGYEYEYEYMTHKLHEYKYLKNVLEYTDTEYFCPKSDIIYIYMCLCYVLCNTNCNTSLL